MIIPYSPTKSKADPLLENSVLNPFTNSLSMHSKGARPHLAMIFILHIINEGWIKNYLLDLENIHILKLSDVKKSKPSKHSKNKGESIGDSLGYSSDSP